MTQNRSFTNNAPLVIAHRGASAYAPENTVPAFQLAISMGADAIEADIQLTKDHEIVVYHDASLGRTIPGHGRLRAYTLTELKQQDAGSFFAPEFKDTKIPTLAEMLDVVGSETLVNLELKSFRTGLGPLVEATIRQLTELEYWENILISSFNPVALVQVRKIAPSMKTGMLISKQTPRLVRWLILALVPHSHAHLEYPLVSEGTIDSAHQQGTDVIVWTINSVQLADSLTGMGVDGIITDHPDRVRACIGPKHGGARW